MLLQEELVSNIQMAQIKGKHKLYEGGEKSDYFCKYCGNKYHTIASLTNGHCIKHPNGPNKGYHSPAL